MLRNLLEEFAIKYLDAKNEILKEHPLAIRFTHESEELVNQIINRPDLIIKSSVGQGNWAEVPWIGIFNPEVSETAQKGFYVVLLFSANMEEIYLCLGQGVTEPRNEFGKKFETEMLRRADLIRDRLPGHEKYFLPGPVSLGGSTKLAKDYDPAVAFYQKYITLDLPHEDDLHNDIILMIQYFDLLVSRGGIDNIETATDLIGDEEGVGETVVERRKYVRHSRIERNSTASKKAKKYLGTMCQACGFDFKKFYGDRGDGYIEAHHLIPLESLEEGESVPMDPKKDFAVLCGNCHRMVHRKKPILTLQELIKLVNSKV